MDTSASFVLYICVYIHTYRIYIYIYHILYIKDPKDPTKNTQKADQ